jgi:D-alanyl-D-alanine dipeptidase
MQGIHVFFAGFGEQQVVGRSKSSGGGCADCTAPASARASEASVDISTGYDCSDARAHTAARSITSIQRRWRERLILLMARRGFVNYSKEWWHFSLPGAGGPAYDFPITARGK